MSGQPAGERIGAELPPGWTVLQAGTTGGRLYVAVWQAFPDATPLEYDCAMAPPPALGWLRPREAVARVKALREARRERPDLTEDRWQRLVRRMWPHLTEAQRQDAHEILAELELGAPAAFEARGDAGGRHGPSPLTTAAEVEATRVELVSKGAPHGERSIARALGVSRDAVRYALGKDR